MLRLTVLTIAVVLAMGTTPAEASSKGQNKAIICKVFKNYCKQALRVSWCESRWEIWAGYKKHQYWGLFQMGTSERARYGHGWNAWAQARAAWRYFVASGKDWSPWSCKPW